jgi:branched-chain amino acid transport system permease protein
VFFQQLVNGVSVGGIYALLASGYALVYSLLGFSNWAHGEVAMAGAYIAWLCISFGSPAAAGAFHLPFPVAALCAIAGAGLISLLNERFFYRPIRERRSPTIFLMIAAMGLSTVFQNGAMLLFGAKFQRYPQLFPVLAIPLGSGAFSVRIGALDLISLIVSAAALLSLDFLITKTKFGLGVRAIASNSWTADVLGINVNRILAAVFFLSGALAGAAGILLGLKYNVYPTMGNIGLKAFTASVFGGLGSVRGAIVGALVIGVIEAFVSGYLNSSLRDLFTFSLLIVILLVKPSGLFGVNVEEKA